MTDIGRGRTADNPSQIPWAGWKDILWRVYGEIGNDRVLLIAGGVTFYLLISIVPALYRWGPSRRPAQWTWLTLGSLVAVLTIAAASIAFSWYVANFGSFNATYGSLGAIVGFMTWIWISVTILLVGAELNAEIEHQTRIDSTIGKPKPMGTRGATMADTIGAANGAGETPYSST